MPRKANNIQNLIPAKKGEIRNPNGKPKGTLDRKTIVDKYGFFEVEKDNPISGESEILSLYELSVLSMFKKVIDSGDVAAFKELMDSGFGKIKDVIENHNIEFKNPFEEMRKNHGLNKETVTSD